MKHLLLLLTSATAFANPEYDATLLGTRGECGYTVADRLKRIRILGDDAVLVAKGKDLYHDLWKYKRDLEREKYALDLMVQTGENSACNAIKKGVPRE